LYNNLLYNLPRRHHGFVMSPRIKLHSMSQMQYRMST